MGTLFSRPIMAGENAAPDQAALLGDQFSSRPALVPRTLPEQ
jgi:hypothetical protein